MTEKQKIEFIREKVIMACHPECKSYEEALTKELIFGCKVSNEDGEFIIFKNAEIDYVYKDTKNEVKYLEYLFNGGQERKECSKKYDFEIIGLPITIGRLIKAMPEVVVDYNKVERINDVLFNDFLIIKSTGEEATIEDQTEETIDLIYNLLT